MRVERTRRCTSAALGLATLLVALGPIAFATTGEMAQGDAKTRPRSTVAGRLSLDVLAKVLKVEENLAKLGPRDTRLDMSRALNGTDDSFQQWQAHLESDGDRAGAITSAGMTPRDYLRAYATIIQAEAVAHAKTSGKPIPERIRSQVADADVAFVEAHSAQLGSLALPDAATLTPNTMEDIYVSDEGAAKDDKKDAAGKAAAGTPAAPADPSKKKAAKKP